LQSDCYQTRTKAYRVTMTISQRDLAMTLANEICSTLASGRHTPLAAAEIEKLVSDCRTLKSLIGDKSHNTIADLIDCLRELQDDVNNPDLLSNALDRANGAKALANDMP